MRLWASGKIPIGDASRHLKTPGNRARLACGNRVRTAKPCVLRSRRASHDPAYPFHRMEALFQFLSVRNARLCAFWPHLRMMRMRESAPRTGSGLHAALFGNGGRYQFGEGTARPSIRCTALFPASVTKVMTLYLLFEQIERAGCRSRRRLKSRLRIRAGPRPRSACAQAARSPSRTPFSLW